LDGRDREVVFKRVDNATCSEIPCLFGNVKQGSATTRSMKYATSRPSDVPVWFCQDYR
jgi:hypothetical protein